jgi:predicted NAD/FAD-dependent oxidoreductase
MDTKDILIIGGGISGLLCANKMQAAGKTVAVLDKGRGVGGRMSTRWGMGAARMDHGAQFFTVRDPRWQVWVQQMQAAGVVREWFRHAPWDTNPMGYPRYCGVDGMNAVPKYLAQGIEVHVSQQVINLQRIESIWIAETQSGERFSGHELVITIPLPQARPLLDSSGLNWANRAARAQMDQVSYERGLATLIHLEGPSAVPAPGCLKLNTDPLVWIADNQKKGISADPILTLHSSAEFAMRHWNSSDSVRGRLMVEAAEEWLGSSVAAFSCHRWGYTTPKNNSEQSIYRNVGLGLTMAGDAFGGAKVEGAALSGLDAAEALLANEVISAVG